ncbi:MAG TPA: hypothetical protein VG267_22555 [Terracidiphilus sp.]|nr:hypothetical protein [Terracidiphilus sp.]
MTHPLARIPFLGPLVDERFLDHRRRASSFAGIVAALVAIALLKYRFFRYGIWDWGLFAVIMVFLVLKMGLFFWYRAHD